MSTNEPNRSYGQGAQGEIAPATKSKSQAKTTTFDLYSFILLYGTFHPASEG